MYKKLFFACCIALTLAACSPAPTKEQVSDSVRKILPTAFEMLEVRELKDIPGLYEVVVRIDKQPVVLYLDKKMKYVFSGSLVSLETKNNLTVESQKRFLPK